MEHTHSEVSIDQMARLARQAGAYSHQHTAEIDGAALNARRHAPVNLARKSIAQRFARAVADFFRG